VNIILGINNNRINLIFVILAVIFSLISLWVAVQETYRLTVKQFDQYYSQYLASTSTENINMDDIINSTTEEDYTPPQWATVVSVLGFIFQIIVCYQWATCINKNIYETQERIDSISQNAKDRDELYDFNWMVEKLNTLKISLLPFWIYLVFSIMGLLLPGAYMLFSILSFVALAYYLNKVFFMSNQLSDIKSQFYSFYLKDDYNPRIDYTVKPRNILYFLLFTFISMGLYWYYLILKLSLEINTYLKSDDILRKKLLQHRKEDME